MVLPVSLDAPSVRPVDYIYWYSHWWNLWVVDVVWVLVVVMGQLAVSRAPYNGVVVQLIRDRIIPVLPVPPRLLWWNSPISQWLP
jgi:hypothetical protein